MAHKLLITLWRPFCQSDIERETLLPAIALASPELAVEYRPRDYLNYKNYNILVIDYNGYLSDLDNCPVVL
jgi:hypothetical protein